MYLTDLTVAYISNCQYIFDSCQILETPNIHCFDTATSNCNEVNQSSLIQFCNKKYFLLILVSTFIFSV